MIYLRRWAAKGLAAHLFFVAADRGGALKLELFFRRGAKGKTASRCAAECWKIRVSGRRAKV